MRAVACSLLFAIAFSGAGCDRTQSSSSPAGSSPASTPAGPAGPVAETPALHAELKAVGAYKKGEPATYEILVRAKTPYHVNDEYPAKYKAADGNGVKHVEPKLERNKHADAFATEPCSAGKDACTLKITVKFTPEQTGTVTLGGSIDVGVCDKDTCIVEKKQLGLAVPVT
jgi:hypothetical protein